MLRGSKGRRVVAEEGSELAVVERSVQGLGAALRVAAAVRAWVCWQKCQISDCSVNSFPFPK